MRRIQSLIRIALPLCLLALVAMPLNAAIVDPDDGAHVGIRVYEGVDPENMAEILRVTSERFVPIISAADGFMAYFLLPEGDTPGGDQHLQDRRTSECRECRRSRFCRRRLRAAAARHAEHHRGRAEHLLQSRRWMTLS